MIPFPREEITDEDSALDWWEQKFAASCEDLGVQINAAALVRELVSSLREIRKTSSDASLSLTVAAAESGYSAGHLGREVKAGRIPNAGRPNAPKILRRDLPRKADRLRSSPSDCMLHRKRIAQAVANSHKGASNG